MPQNIPLIQWVIVDCHKCGTSGKAGWQAGDLIGGPRKLMSLSEGFCSIDQGTGEEPKIRCMRCHDTHAACKEARSGLAPPQKPGCAA